MKILVRLFMISSIAIMPGMLLADDNPEQEHADAERQENFDAALQEDLNSDNPDTRARAEYYRERQLEQGREQLREIWARNAAAKADPFKEVAGGRAGFDHFVNVSLEAADKLIAEIKIWASAARTGQTRMIEEARKLREILERDPGSRKSNEDRAKEKSLKAQKIDPGIKEAYAVLERAQVMKQDVRNKQAQADNRPPTLESKDVADFMQKTSAQQAATCENLLAVIGMFKEAGQKHPPKSTPEQPSNDAVLSFESSNCDALIEPPARR